MRKAIQKTLEQERLIKVVGEASTFAQTMQMVVDFKPEVLLLDLYLAEKRELAPALISHALTP